MAMSETASRMLAGLVEARTGQRCEAGGNWRVEARIGSVMVRHGIADHDELVSRIVGPKGDLLARDVVDAVLNNETSFFRDADVFRQVAAFIREADRRLDPGRTMRIWSAGCSTGQELYSLAMLIADDLDGLGGRPIELVGSDVSHQAIARAERGAYTRFEIQRGLPVRKMLRWFEPQGEIWQARPRLAEMVRFRRHDFLETPPTGFFQLILCRNVLMYFPDTNRERALAQFACSLAPGGGLVLGAGETVLGRSDRFAFAEGLPGIYTLKPPEMEHMRHRA